MRLPRLAFVAVPSIGVALLASACEPISSTPTPTGQLGNAQFTYVCPPGAVDTACPQAASATSTTRTTKLPKVIAVGAAFTVTYADVPNDDTAIQGVTGGAVTPASTLLAEPSGEALVTKHAGYLALLAGAAGQTVDDFVLVDLEPIATLTLPSSDVFVAPGEDTSLHATAEDAAGDTLAGRLACAWSFTSGSSAGLEGSTTTAAIKVRGLKVGDTALEVRCGGQTTAVTVHVTSAPDSGDAGTDGALEGGEG